MAITAVEVLAAKNIKGEKEGGKRPNSKKKMPREP